jgi:hypothetical protein
LPKVVNKTRDGKVTCRYIRGASKSPSAASSSDGQ